MFFKKIVIGKVFLSQYEGNIKSKSKKKVNFIKETKTTRLLTIILIEVYVILI